MSRKNEFYNGTRNKNTDITAVQTITTAVTTLVAENFERRKISIQNTGTNPILLSLGGTASTTEHNKVLAGGSTLRDGTGGYYESESWKGSISAVTETSTTTITIIEEEY